MNRLDDIDCKLLGLLQADGRMPLAELGKTVGLSTSSVSERVRRLHRCGVIAGVYSSLSPAALDLDLLASSSSPGPIRRRNSRSWILLPENPRSSNATA